MVKRFYEVLVACRLAAATGCSYDWSLHHRDAGLGDASESVELPTVDAEAVEDDADAGADAKADDAEIETDAALDDAGIANVHPDPVACTAGTAADGVGVCRDIDECKTGTADCDLEPRACVNTDPSDGQPFKCQCPPGYAGAGRGPDGCTDIDECSTGAASCDALAPCKNVPGSYTCGDCPAGYSGGAGGACTDIDECGTNHGGCDALASCDNAPGTFSCGSCPAGYAGDGKAGCIPTLTGLTVSIGDISPSLANNVTQYTVRVGITTQTVTVTPTAPSGATIAVAGSEVAVGGAWTSGVLNLGDNTVSVIVGQAGHASRTYTLTIKRGSVEAYIKASNSSAGIGFGTSVAMANGRLVIGAPAESGPAPGGTVGLVGSGAAYVFERQVNEWVQTLYLKADNADAGDAFGASVAIPSYHNGAGTTPQFIVIGAPGEDGQAVSGAVDPSNNASSDSGAAYVFDSKGTRIAYLKARYTDSGDRFGKSVAVWNNFVAAGAPGEDSKGPIVNSDDNSAIDSGAVFGFKCSTHGCSLQVGQKAYNTHAGDALGTSIAMSGTPSGNVDPTTAMILVGAPGEDSSILNVGNPRETTNTGATDSGAAYLLSTGGGVLAYLKASNTNEGDAFGTSVSMNGNLIAVGAPNEASSAFGSNGNQADNTAARSGAAYVFASSGATWVTSAYLKATNTGARDNFGAAVAVGTSTIVVGAPGESSRASGVGGNQLDDTMRWSGAAYTYVSSGGAWIPQAYLKASNPDISDGFGQSVAIDGEAIAVGAAFEASAGVGVNNATPADNSAAQSGAAYIFR